VLQHGIFILFPSLGLQGFILVSIDIKGFHFGFTSWCLLNWFLQVPKQLYIDTLTADYLLGNLLKERLLVEIFHCLMMKSFCPLNMVMANISKSHCQSSCKVIVRFVVKGLLSEGFCQSCCCWRASVRWLLSEWLLSGSYFQRVCITVATIRELLSEGFCQSGCLLASGCC